MDLCGIMRVKSVNGKKYILVTVDDYSRFTWVKCLRSKDEAPYFIIKFLKIIQVRLTVSVRRIQTDNGTEFVNQTLREYYEQVGISHETLVSRSPQQNDVVERRNRTLIEAAHTMLIYAQASLFLWTEAVTTACYTQNRSMIRLRHRKTPYELLHKKLPNLSFLHVFGALCYPTNDSENLGKLQPKADIRIFIGPALNEMTPATISSGLVQKPSSSTPYVPPSRNDWDLLFQPLFDELLTPPLSVDPQAPEVIASIADVIPPLQAESTDVEEDIHDIEVAHMGNDSLFGVPIPEVIYDKSSSTVSPYTIVRPDHQIPQHNSKWTKDHPLDNIIVEPKTYKDALSQSCWIEAMQEKLNEFERLNVWELVPQTYKVTVITLKWIYKVKLDELGGILKNKTRLVACGYRQKEGKTVHMLCRPRPNSNALNRVAIGYKNPLCLIHAKQVQSALYNGHEIIKDNHTPAIVHNSKDTLEIAEITRKKMNDKMNDPECVTRKVKIAHHDYSKENLLATFTPQKQLTPKQIFWSNDLMNLKSEALKERTKVSKPIKAFTV
nr:hypothetical protein [Tanacetum cinerariifolium]